MHMMNPIARVLLQGLYDENSELHKLKGMWHILREIWRYIISYWRLHIKCTTGKNTGIGLALCPNKRLHEQYKVEGVKSFLNLSSCTIYHSSHYPYISSSISFPQPSGLNINMMPFVMENTFEKCLLPKYLEEYWLLLIKKCPIGDDDIGKVGYLTIQEGFFDKSNSQMRLGIHIEKPGKLILCETEEQSNNRFNPSRGGGSSFINRQHWGFGGRGKIGVTQLEGGIFMASTVDNFCAIWNCQIVKDDIIGETGDVEHLREFLPDSELMKKNQIYWLTDRTPLELSPLKRGTYMQFFRLMTSKVSLWYEDNSSKNPVGVLPDPSITKIVRRSKFDKADIAVIKKVDAFNNLSDSGRSNIGQRCKSELPFPKRIKRYNLCNYAIWTR